MKNPPTDDQLSQAHTWTKLYELMGVAPKNTRAQKVVQEYVRTNCPQAEVLKGQRGLLSDTDFSVIVARSFSVRQIIIEAGWKMSGGAYGSVSERIKRLGLSTEHFKGQGHNKDQPARNKRPIEDYLVVDCHAISSHDLKLRLIKEGIKERGCEKCRRTEWKGLPIPITLDHIDGDHYNNTLSNLRILCPNCHAQTPTFSRRKVVRAPGLEPG